MSQPPPVPDTPLIRRILTLVAATCDPRAARWRERLAVALAELFHAPWAAHGVLRAEDLERLSARVDVLEAAHSRSPGTNWTQDNHNLANR